MNFYTQDDISRVNPSGQKVTKHGVTRYMYFSVRQAHKFFTEKYPDIEVCLSTFYHQKPKKH